VILCARVLEGLSLLPRSMRGFALWLLVFERSLLGAMRAAAEPEASRLVWALLRHINLMD